MARDDGERDVEPPMVQMDVGAANLGVERSEQCGAGFEVGAWNVPEDQRLAGASHDSGEGHDTNIATRSMKRRTSLSAMVGGGGYRPGDRLSAEAVG